MLTSSCYVTFQYIQELLGAFLALCILMDYSLWIDTLYTWDRPLYVSRDVRL